MANKTMHHMIHGDDTYEIVDKAARENVSNLSALKLSMMSEHLVKTLSIEELQGSYYTSAWKAFQSIAYNSNLNRIVLGFSSGDGDNTKPGLIVELDSDWSFLRRVEVSAGHLNDITYNPNTGKYYIATSLSASSGNVVVVDQTTLAVDSVKSVSGIDAIGQLSYDADNNVYYATDTSYKVYLVDSELAAGVYKYTQNQNKIYKNSYADITVKYLQGSCVYDGQFISALWLGSSNSNSPSYGRLCWFDSDERVYFYDFRSQVQSDEFEGITVIDDVIYGASYSGKNLYINAIHPNGAIGKDYDKPVVPYKQVFEGTSSGKSVVVITHGSSRFSALVDIRYNHGRGNSLIYINGYGPGGTARDYAQPLTGGADVLTSSIVDNKIYITSSYEPKSGLTAEGVTIMMFEGNINELSVSFENPA